MDESTVREHAEAHADAMSKGDLARAATDLTEQAKSMAPDVMKAIPRQIESAEVTAVEETAGMWIARIVYRGEDRATTVSSSWEDAGERPMITALEVL